MPNVFFFFFLVKQASANALFLAEQEMEAMADVFNR